MASSNSFLQFVMDNPFTGSGFITILDPNGFPSNYQLAYGSWTPNVAKRKINTLAGQAIYSDVLEEMTLNILGNSAAECTNNLQALWKFLDTAERWANGVFCPYVYIGYRPKGSNLSTVPRADILANLSDQSILSLPATYDDVGHIWRINGVTIRFLRRGEWLGVIDTANNTGLVGRKSNAVILSAGNGISAPTDLQLGNFNNSTMPVAVPSSVLIVADANFYGSGSSHLLREIQASTMTATGYTSVADATNNSVWGNILRYTPTNTLYVQSGAANVTSGVSDTMGRNAAVYITARTNAGATGFLVRLLATPGNFQTRPIFIDGSSLSPRTFALGVIQLSDQSSPAVQIAFQIAALSAAGSLDIDQIILVGIDNETTSIFELDPFSLVTTADAIYLQHNQGARQDNSLFKHTEPAVMLNLNRPMNYIGTMPVMTLADAKHFVWLCPRDTKWQYRTNANGQVTLTLTVNRSQAYMVPE